MTQTTRAVLLALAAFVLSACASAHRVEPAISLEPSACEDLLFLGRYLPGAAGGKPTRFRANLRLCRNAPLVFEIRGRIGAAVLSGAVGGGHARWIFPKERLAIDGPDDPRVWLAWTGLPLSEAMLRLLLGDFREGKTELGEWSIRRELAGGAFSAEAISARGDSLNLVLGRRSPARGRALWPTPPATFRVVQVTADDPRPEGIFHEK